MVYLSNICLKRLKVLGFPPSGRSFEETQRDLGGAAEARRAAGRGAGSHRNGAAQRAVTGPVVPWVSHGFPMGFPWKNHGKTMGKPWENHGKMVKNHRNMGYFNVFHPEFPWGMGFFLS